MSNIRATFSINAAGTVWGAIDGDISNQTDLQDALDLKADKSKLETDIEEVNTAISNLSDTVLDNYNTLDDKIDTEISNRLTADEDLQNNIDTLGDTVADNYTELNNKILDNTANITINTGLITNINSKIPEQASAVNQLADKNFVNSSIATNTANFIGTFNSITELEAYSGTLTNNDYAFVATTDTAGNTLYDRYKWNGLEWLFEYELNNSSFTANQWAAINSGITNTLTTQITTNQNAITNIQNNYVPNTRTINSKALNTNITLNALDVGALANTTTINDLTTTAQQNALNSGATSAKISQIATNTNAISTINGKIPADSSSSNKLVTASALSNAVVDLANQDLSNLTETGNNRLHALKAYSDNGELLTDTEGLADVIKYAHSTFDLSKFTVVGSPVITDDGVASGFSAYTTYIQTPIKASELLNKSWEIHSVVNGNGYSWCVPVCFTQGTWGDINSNITSRYGAGNVYLNLKTGDSEGTSQLAYSDNYKFNIINYQSQTCEVVLAFDYPTGIYSFYFIDEAGNKRQEKTYTPTSTNKQLYEITSTNNYIAFGGGINAGSYNTNAQFDLKQFSITVEGVEVFSGNKTGIDTIKPDNYTVVGSPTISADGIASGFSNNNRLQIPNFPISNFKDKSWEIEGEFIMEGTSAGFWRTVLGVGSLYQSQWGLTFYNNTQEFNFYCRFGDTDESDTSQTARIGHNLTSSTYGYSIGDTIQYELSFDISTGVYTLAIKRKDETNWHIKTYTPTTSNKQMYDIVANPNFLLLIGGTTRNTYYNGSIDLNSFKIYVDGNLVYQPCLKIPYTQSKTGSKIVNAIYRDRVNDMASQFGYANYYTLDEDNGNFTLPQVELSGLIGDKTLRDSYYNGATYWELYSNRRLEQGGSCESGVEYTLPKPFADANYILTIPYSSKTATSFIPSATGDFIAKGTGLL